MKNKPYFNENLKTLKTSIYNSFLFRLSACGVLLLGLSPLGASAQSTVNASGGSVVISGNLYAYSIGEMVLVSTETGSSFTVTQGVLQASGDPLGTNESTLLPEGLSLYPNPAANTLYLQPNFSGGGELSLRLFDLRGRLILHKDINLQTGLERQQLDLSPLQEGTYLLKTKLHQGERIYEHSFKVIKFNEP